MALPALRPMVLIACGLVAVFAAVDVNAQGSQGENFSAGKSPAQLFSSDCTGGGCHRGPQGLAKGRSSSSLADFLREHYTNSRESAAVLANYLLGAPGGGDARAARPGSDGAPQSRPATVRRDDTGKPPRETGTPAPASPRQTLRQPPKTDDAAKPATARTSPVQPAAAATRTQPPPPPPLAMPREEIFD